MASAYCDAHIGRGDTPGAGETAPSILGSHGSRIKHEKNVSLRNLALSMRVCDELYCICKRENFVKCGFSVSNYKALRVQFICKNLVF